MNVNLLYCCLAVASPFYLSVQAYGETLPLIENVVVEGSRMDQSLIETPNSVTVFDRQIIEQSGILNIRDIDDLAPNVSINQMGQLGGSFISIRGIESNPFIVNRTAVYIDGIPYREPGIINLKNAEQIEILRGPQSTLYGASADAGIIVINTRMSQDDFATDLYSGINFFEGRNSYTAGAYVSGGFTDNLLASFSFDLEKGDSYIKNIASSTGEEGEIEDMALNGKIRYDLGDVNQFDMTLFYNRLRAPGLYEQEFPALNRDTYNNVYATTNNVGFTAGDFELVNDAPKNTEEDEYGIGMAYSHNFSRFSVDTAAAYRNIDEDSFGTDLDLTAAPFSAGGTLLDREFWNFETRFHNNKSDSPIKWLLGFSYYQQDRTLSLATLVGPGGLDDYQRAPEQSASNEDVSAFAQFVIPLADKIKLTTGLRYEQFDAKSEQEAGILSLGPGFDFTFPELSRSTDGDIWLPKLALSYELGRNKQLYFSSSRGHLSGGYNLIAAQSGDLIDQRFGSYDPEELWSYEIGTKLSLLDDNLFLSSAIFYIDASSWQEVNILTAPDGSVISTSLINSDAAVETKGFELEIKYQATQELRLSTGLGYVNAEYEEYNFSTAQDLAGNFSTVEDVTGNKVKLIPEYDFAFIANYAFNDRWYLQAEFHALGDTPLNAENTVTRKQVNVFDFSAGYRWDNWSFRLYVDNATNERYASGQAYQNFLLGNDGVDYAPLAEPRIVGLEVSYGIGK